MKKQDIEIDTEETPISYSCIYDTSYSGDCDSSNSIEAIESFKELDFKTEDESIWNNYFTREDRVDYKSACEEILCNKERKYSVTCPGIARAQLPFFNWLGFAGAGVILILFYFFRKRDVLQEGL